MIVAVIEECARLLCGEFVNIRISGLDRRLCDECRPIHLVRQNQTVPVDRRTLGQSAMHNDPDVIALVNSQTWAWYFAAIRECINCDIRQDVPTDYRNFQIEDL